MNDNEKPVDLVAIEVRLAAATPGPYSSVYAVNEDGPAIRIGFLEETEDGLIATYATEADENLFANAPTDIAALIAEVKRLRAELSQCLRVVILPADDSDFYMPDEVKE